MSLSIGPKVASLSIKSSEFKSDVLALSIDLWVMLGLGTVSRTEDLDKSFGSREPESISWSPEEKITIRIIAKSTNPPEINPI